MSFEITKDKALDFRQQYLANAKRVVVKVGSAVLTSESGLNHEAMLNLAREISFLRKSGREVILVSSGAVAAGRRKLGIESKGIGIKEKQAIAAVGQSSLMRAYEDIFESEGIKVAQVLLTHEDLSHRDRYLNARNTLFTLLDWGLLPIINENDTVSVEELRFGDNDNLAANITNLIEADIFICLTDVDGLYTGNPTTDPEAMPVYTVKKVDAGIQDMAGNVNSALGTGGMQSKILAARMVSARGGCSFIGPGKKEGILHDLFSLDPVGTFFLPRKEKIKSRKHWIAFTLRPKGFLVLDDGAGKAITRHGKSLLPSGITEVRGRFGVGAPVHCLDSSGFEIAAGLVNYKSTEIEKIQGVNTCKIEKILGYKDSDEVIHRDNLVIL